jgi:hypothetical protein
MTEDQKQRIIRAAENILSECHTYELPQFDGEGMYGPESELGELANALRDASRFVPEGCLIGLADADLYPTMENER